MLALLYLANDVVQTARHSGSKDVVLALGEKFPKAVAALAAAQPAYKPKIAKLVNLWETRKVYDAKFSAHLRSRAGLGSGPSSSSSGSSGSSSSSSSSAKSGGESTVDSTMVGVIKMPVVVALKDVVAVEELRKSGQEAVETIDIDAVIASDSAPVVRTTRLLLEGYHAQIGNEIQARKILVSHLESLLASHSSSIVDLSEELAGLDRILSSLPAPQ